MSKQKLPNEIIIFPNLDKMNHEKPDMSDLANMPKPSRIILCAEPNLGKSNIIKLMLVHAEPIFERIVIYHSDPTSKEYTDIDAEYICDEIPEIDFWDENVKNLFILEDINFKRLKRDQRDLIDRYYGCFSTHHNISVWATFQRAFSCPPEIRDMSNIMLLWKTKNVNALSLLSSRLGIEADDLKYIFKNICKDKYDFLVIDSTRPTCRLRKNLFEVITYNN